MYKIILSCSGIPSEVGAKGAADITREFVNRPWYQNVICIWDEKNQSLILQAISDIDNDGIALIDEFSDTISICIIDAGDGDIHVVSVTTFNE